MTVIQEWEGHLLCSRRDPLKEADQWAAAQNCSSSHCWILGLGAGYHIESFARRYPEVVISVIDHREALKIHFRDQYSSLASQVQIEIVQNEDDLLRTKSFHLFGASVSTIHQFRPAIQSCEDLYLRFSRSIRGQTLKSCLMLSEMMSLGLSREAIAHFQDFHIKEISPALQKEGDPEAQKWVRVLRELVV